VLVIGLEVVNQIMQKSSIDIFSVNKICVRPICLTNFQYLTVQQIAVFLQNICSSYVVYLAIIQNDEKLRTAKRCCKVSLF